VHFERILPIFFKMKIGEIHIQCIINTCNKKFWRVTKFYSVENSSSWLFINVRSFVRPFVRSFVRSWMFLVPISNLPLHHGKNELLLTTCRWWWCSLWTNTPSWIFTELTQWKKSPRKDISLHLDTLSGFRAKQSVTPYWPLMKRA